MEIMVAVGSLILAVIIGAWRQNCIFWELMDPYNCPRLWRTSASSIVLTWIATAVFSTIFAFIIATWIVNEVSDFVGRFSFGVLLVARWYISQLIGLAVAHAELEKEKKETDIE